MADKRKNTTKQDQNTTKTHDHDHDNDQYDQFARKVMSYLVVCHLKNTTDHDQVALLVVVGADPSCKDVLPPLQPLPPVPVQVIRPDSPPVRANDESEEEEEGETSSEDETSSESDKSEFESEDDSEEDDLEEDSSSEYESSDSNTSDSDAPIAVSTPKKPRRF